MRKLILLTAILFFTVVSLSNISYADKPALKIASYWNKIKGNIVQCVLCPRKCIIDNGQRGLCTVRVNKDGTLYTLGYGNPVAVNIDPIEKKPFFNVLPGTDAFSIAVAGCNMRCLF